MQCEQFETRFQQLVDERRALGEDFQLREHALECPQCAATLSGWDALLGGLDALDAAVDSAPPSNKPALSDEDFAWQVVLACRAVDSPAPAARRRTGRWIGFLMATSASLLLLAGASWMAWRAEFSMNEPVVSVSPGDRMRADDPESAPESTDQQPPVTDGGPTDPKLPGRGVAAAESPMLEDDTVSEEGPLSEEDLAQRIMQAVADVTENPTLQRETSHWMTQVGVGLRPVTESVTGTINTIRRTIPAVRPQKSPKAEAGAWRTAGHGNLS